MTPQEMAEFNGVLAGLAGEQCDPDDIARFKADIIAPAFNVGNGGKIPSFQLGESVGQHKGGQPLGGAAERAQEPGLAPIEALSAAEKREIVISHEKGWAWQSSPGATPEQNLAVYRGVCVAKAERELRAYNEKLLDTFLRSGWNSGVSAALGAGSRFTDADANVRDAVVALIQGTDADTLILDQYSDEHLRKHGDFRSALAANVTKAVNPDALRAVLQGDCPALKQVIVLDAQNNPANPRNPICGVTSGFAWAGRLLPGTMPTTADKAATRLRSHNFAFLRGFHTAASNPALAFGARLNNRANSALSGALAATTVLADERRALHTKVTVYATGKFSQVNNLFGAALTNTWVA